MGTVKGAKMKRQIDTRAALAFEVLRNQPDLSDAAALAAEVLEQIFHEAEGTPEDCPACDAAPQSIKVEIVEAPGREPAPEEWPSDRPRFQHDCAECRFLGHYHGRDVYVSEQFDTIICRGGNDGPDFYSYPPSFLVQRIGTVDTPAMSSAICALAAQQCELFKKAAEVYTAESLTIPAGLPPALYTALLYWLNRVSYATAKPTKSGGMRLQWSEGPLSFTLKIRHDGEKTTEEKNDR